MNETSQMTDEYFVVPLSEDQIDLNIDCQSSPVTEEKDFTDAPQTEEESNSSNEPFVDEEPTSESVATVSESSTTVSDTVSPDTTVEPDYSDEDLTSDMNRKKDGDSWGLWG